MHARKLSLILAMVAALVRRSPAEELGVRIRFGLTGLTAQSWDGTVSVEPGTVERIDGWRFEQDDAIIGTSGWKASTRALEGWGSNNPAIGALARLGLESQSGSAAVPAFFRNHGLHRNDNGVILLLTDVSEASVVRVQTKQRSFDFKLSEIPYGSFIERLGGAVDVEPVAASRSVTSDQTDDDYPSLAAGAGDTTYLAWISFASGVDRRKWAACAEGNIADSPYPGAWTKSPEDFSFLAKPPGGDRLWMAAVKDGQAGPPLAATEHGDLYKCAVAVDGQNRPWIFWSENKEWTRQDMANFEIWGRCVENGALSAPINLSANPGNDIWPVAATDGQGRIWVAWQGARDGAFRILDRHQDGHGGWTPERQVSPQSGSCWNPAIAARRGRSSPGGAKRDGASGNGAIAIAWDTYDKGDYDVWLRKFDPDGQARAPQPVADTAKFESRAFVTLDHDGRLWILWEEGGPLWGKDFGAYAINIEIALYRERQIGLRVLADGRWFDPKSSYLKCLVGAQPRRGPGNLLPRIPEGEFASSWQARLPGKAINPVGNGNYNDSAALTCDGNGHICVLLRSREGTFMTPEGSIWLDYLVYYDGKDWKGPVIVPHSDNFLYALPAVAARSEGALLIGHSSDRRQERSGATPGLEWVGGLFVNGIYLSRMELPRETVKMTLVPSEETPEADQSLTRATIDERTAVARCRAYQIELNGRTLHLRRGEFHRHTEFSSDGAFDGSLEDMWRYGIDVADMDWLGCGDHDNGDGSEYLWWLTQKTTDAYRIPGCFDPPFTYERSVGFPEGHRNVIFAQRGIRILPRLPRTKPKPVIHAPDTQMLCRYVRFFHGVFAPHTSGTRSMGTDWCDHDDEVEPMVEIYQGDRQDCERPWGAPRAPTLEDAIGGWNPKGWVRNLLMAGGKIAFEASSDHWSTHLSYTMVYTEGTSREDLLQAMRARHIYGATANIVADFRCTSDGRDYMLGDAFSASQSPGFRLRLIGTVPFPKVTWIKDDVEVIVTKPHRSDVEMTWSDPRPPAGKTSYVYVRGEQEYGEVVLVSLIWVTYPPATDGSGSRP